MASAPPPLLVSLIEKLIPPDAREAVLGDLLERYRSPTHFAGQALCVLPFLIFAQVTRRSSWPILGLQSFVLFACLRGFAPAATGSGTPAWARAALPTLCALLALGWHDAYRSSEAEARVHPALAAAVAVLIGIGVSQMLTMAVVAAAPLPGAWLLTVSQLLFVTAALPILSVFRAKPWFQLDHREPMRQIYDRFRSRVGHRNRLEVGAMLATIAVAGLILLRAGTPPPVSVWLTLAGFALLSFYLAARGGAARLSIGVSPSEINRLFRREALRQHRLRGLLLWWWLAPLFIGLAQNFLLAAAAVRPIAGVLLMLLLAVCIKTANDERGVLLSRRIDALRSL